MDSESDISIELSKKLNDKIYEIKDIVVDVTSISLVHTIHRTLYYLNAYLSPKERRLIHELTASSDFSNHIIAANIILNI